MGRMLGAFDGDEIDRPDLNKCPDCGCFFAQDECPICGKVCPEEMRAGNRKPVKQKRNGSSGGSGRVVFVNWYHSWWFMALMLFIFPLIAIILLATSPYKKKHKIIAFIIAGLYLIISTFGIGNILGLIDRAFNSPVDTSLSKEEYIAACEETTPEAFYRSSAGYNGKFVSFTLIIEQKLVDSNGYYNNEEYTTYYICSAEDGAEYEILVRDCIQDGSVNFIAGDLITVYGEGAGNVTVYDMDYLPHTAPCINAAYVIQR